MQRRRTLPWWSCTSRVGSKKGGVLVADRWQQLEGRRHQGSRAERVRGFYKVSLSCGAGSLIAPRAPFSRQGAFNLTCEPSQVIGKCSRGEV